MKLLFLCVLMMTSFCGRKIKAQEKNPEIVNKGELHVNRTTSCKLGVSKK
ncbi:MAG: hypothetical protein H7281_01660 [Bacteriovorax sp.]|nr:hypothetical protein [Bacteriovorax sp.]